MDADEIPVELAVFLSERVCEALKANDVARLQALRESGESLGLSDEEGNNLLHLAIYEYASQGTSTMEAFEYLLTLPEIDKNKLNSDSISPLIAAFICTGDYSEYAFKLIESDCELPREFSIETTNLMLAVRNDWPEVVELLIEKGVDFDEQLSDGKTALHLTASLKRTDMIWMLLFYGANPNKWCIDVYDITFPLNRRMNFYDFIYAAADDSILDRFSNFDKHVGLTTVIEAMQLGTDSFNKLLNTTSTIHFHQDELKILLGRFHSLKTTAFKNFLQKYEFIVEEAFLIPINLRELFRIDNSTMLKNFCEIFFILLESDIVATVVDAINENSDPLIFYLIKLFPLEKNQLELLTQILCCLLSYGVHITPEAMDQLFFTFGHCELFRIMLFMTFGERKLNVWHGATWPKLIYDVTVNEKQFLSTLSYDDATNYDIPKYCTAPSIYDRRLPSLLELARRASREYIISEKRPKNCMQFYKILQELEITHHCKDIISFKQMLYPDGNILFHKPYDQLVEECQLLRISTDDS